MELDNRLCRGRMTKQGLGTDRPFRGDRVFWFANEVARRVGCDPSSAMRWCDQRAREGDGVYQVRTSPGRPPRLQAKQKRRLVRLLEAIS